MAEWKATMSRPEFFEWIRFYRRWPFDDLHRHHRPAAFIARQMRGGDMDQMVQFLQPSYDLPDDLGDVDRSVLRALGIKQFGDE